MPVLEWVTQPISLPITERYAPLDAATTARDPSSSGRVSSTCFVRFTLSVVVSIPATASHHVGDCDNRCPNQPFSRLIGHLALAMRVIQSNDEIGMT